MIESFIILGTQDVRLRKQWGASLASTMRSLGVSRKELVSRLGTLGAPVSQQAVGQWIRGETSPRPYHQAVIGQALGVPPQVIFAIQAAS